MDFLRPFADFVQSYLVNHERQHLLNNPEFLWARETAEKLREIITNECMVLGTEKMLELYDEAESYMAAMGTQNAFMAGFRLALELLVLANNPQPLISPPWSRNREYWQEIEQRASEVLEKAKAVRTKKAG